MRRLLATLVAILLGIGGVSAEEALQKFVFEKAEMGLPFRVSLYAPDEVQAKAAADAAFERVAVLNSIFSDYDPESELSRLSRTAGQGKAVPVSSTLWLLLERGQRLAERSGGAFDITVGPLVNLWRRARRKQELPSAELIAEMKARVGFKNLRLDPARRTAELLVPEMRLDLGSIGKAFAVDEALAVVRSRGFARALIAGSGDMAAGEAPPGLPGWRVQVATLDAPGAPAAQIVYLRNCGIATSGDAYQRVEIAGKRYSHIVDPRTGIGVTDHSLVTVVAPDVATANGLSTSLSVLGPVRGIPLVEETPGAAARIVRQPAGVAELIESARWKDVPEVDAAR